LSCYNNVFAALEVALAANGPLIEGDEIEGGESTSTVAFLPFL
jgi:hypothetical protein